MSTISNHSSINPKTLHTSRTEDPNATKEISTNLESKYSKFLDAIKNPYKSIADNATKKDFQATVINPSKEEKTASTRVDNSDVSCGETPRQEQNDQTSEKSKKYKDPNFCIETYMREFDEYLKKFDENKAKWKTPLQAIFKGSIQGIKLGLLLGCLIFAAKKIAVSAIITNLINCNKHFFKA